MSAKSGIKWRFSERSVYCYGSKQAEQMPYRIYLYHKTRVTVYGFLNVRLALNFLFERVKEDDAIYYDEDYCNSYYMVGNANFVSKCRVSELLIDHYRCPLLYCEGV